MSGLEIADSKVHPQLQVADLVAGVACTLMKAKALNDADDYGGALDNAGVLSFVGGGSWPTSAISPDALETEGPVLTDSADFR